MFKNIDEKKAVQNLKYPAKRFLLAVAWIGGSMMTIMITLIWPVQIITAGVIFYCLSEIIKGYDSKLKIRKQMQSELAKLRFHTKPQQKILGYSGKQKTKRKSFSRRVRKQLAG